MTGKERKDVKDEKLSDKFLPEDSSHICFLLFDEGQ